MSYAPSQLYPMTMPYSEMTLPSEEEREPLEMVSRYDFYYNRAYLAWDPFFPEAEQDLRMYLGDQWDQKEKELLNNEGRSTFVVNRVQPNIHQVTGYQRKHRTSSIALPREPQDQAAADDLTQLGLYAFSVGNAYQTLSDAFEGALITGHNLISTWMDYRSDPLNGEVAFDREPYNAFITDPYFTKTDLSDCGYILRRRYLSLIQTLSLLPKRQQEIKNLYAKGWDRDNKFTWLPYQRQPNGQQMMAYDEYWEQSWEKKKFLFDAQTGEEFPMEGKDDNALLFNPDLQIIEKEVKCVYLHIFVNSQFIQTEKNPNGLDEYPFVYLPAIFKPEADVWSLRVQSLVRVMKDPQKESNRRRSQLVDMMESQITTGYIATSDSVVNPESLYQTGQGKVIWKKRDAAPDSVMPLQHPNIDAAYFQAQQSYDADLQFVANISDVLSGQADMTADSGIKFALRQGAALVGLQLYFDNLRFAQKELTRKIYKMLMFNWSQQKMTRVLGHEPDPKLLNSSNLRYDISVQEGLLTDTQQQMFFAQMVDLKALGEPQPPGFLTRIAPIQGKTEYNKMLEEYNQQQQQAAQKQEETQQQLINAQTELARTQSMSNMGMAKERFSRAHSNFGLEAERASEALDNRADAVYKRAKAAKELSMMDDERLVNLLDLFQRLEDQQAAKETVIKEDMHASAPASEAVETMEIK